MELLFNCNAVPQGVSDHWKIAHTVIHFMQQYTSISEI